MVHHDWGDEGVDWKGINDAADYIHDFCVKWGRFGGQAKEKFGTVRFYASFNWLSFHGLCYPGYVYSQFPDWLWKLDCKIISPILRFFFDKPVYKYRCFIYRTAYLNALKKWPHLKEEIICCMDYPELIK